MIRPGNALAVVIALYATPAFAACTVPNALTNGQVADAAEVMDNFNAVADCADQAVTPTGTPTAGSIAVFSGAQTVTAGDLSGDVTTSGGTAATLAATGVTAGSYTNPVVTVDAKGRVTSIANGSIASPGGAYTKFVVATAGDAFIDVPLDSDNGYAYSVIVKGAPSTDATLFFRLSSDNGTSFYSGASDYKWGGSGGSGAAASISLSNGNTIVSGRNTLATFTLLGMNVTAGEKAALTGTIFSIITPATPTNMNSTIGGHQNVLAANNFNAFRIAVNAGNMNGFAVYVQKLY